MENDWPPFSDARPVVAFVVLGAALTCCCLLTASTALISYWWTSRTITPTPLPASPPGITFAKVRMRGDDSSDSPVVHFLEKDRLAASSLDLDHQAVPPAPMAFHPGAPDIPKPGQ
jgi:hypothetical protein